LPDKLKMVLTPRSCSVRMINWDPSTYVSAMAAFGECHAPTTSSPRWQYQLSFDLDAIG
jgi:hypothetical protein